MRKFEYKYILAKAVRAQQYLSVCSVDGEDIYDLQDKGVIRDRRLSSVLDKLGIDGK